MRTSSTTLKLLFLAGISLLALTPYVAGGPAFANDDRPASQAYARYGWWDIRLFRDGTCFASAAYDYNQHIRIGINGPEDYYVMLASPGVQRLAAVKGFPLLTKFDNGQDFSGKANVNLSENGEVNIMEFQIGSAMLGSFMVSNNMHIYARTKEGGWKVVASMNLQGSYAAMLKTAECTAANGSHYSRPTNPFQNVSQ